MKNKILAFLTALMLLLFFSSMYGLITTYFDYQKEKKELVEYKIIDKTGVINKEKEEINNFPENNFTGVIINSQTGITKTQTGFLGNLDFKSDNSLTKYVSANISFDKINYEPDDLVLIKGEYIEDTKGNQKLRLDAQSALLEMAKDFYSNFKVKLKIVSAYRSYSYQKGIKDRGCSDLFCAKAGYSEHQTGLAADLFEATSEKEFLSKPNLKIYFEWLSSNAYKYGFHNSYQKGIEIDTYAIEPWHWRYLGVDLATYLKNANITYTEFYKESN